MGGGRKGPQGVRIGSGEGFTMRKFIKSRLLRCPGYIARKGEGGGIFKMLICKPAGKRLLGTGSDANIWIEGGWEWGMQKPSSRGISLNVED